MIAAGAVIVGLVFFVMGYLGLKKNRAMLMWLSVEGAVVRSEVKWTGQEYSPLIEYNYKVGGEQYSGDTVRSFLVRYNWPGPAKNLCEKYPNGSRVPVYYDPNDPSRSVLEPLGSPDSPKYFMVLGIFVVCCALVAMLLH